MTDWYSTQLGIIAATAIGVSILKRVLGNVKYANTIPTWVYAVGVSSLLTFLAVQVWQTLPGALWPLISQAATGAAGSSGFYEWVTKHPTTSLASSALSANVPIDPGNLPGRDVLTVGPRP